MNRLIRKAMAVAALVAATVVVVASTQAAGWGSIKGKFVLDGAAPKLAAIDASKDAFCVSAHPVSETVVVGKDGALANVVVFLRTAAGKTVEVHPDYAATKDQPVTLDNKGCAFRSHVTLVRTGQPFIIKNSDPLGHNTKADLDKNASFNQTIAAGADLTMKFDKSEALPRPVNCGIHPFMSGYLLIKDNPYMVVSGEDGSFEIKNIPAGKQEFVFWQEVHGYLKELKYKGGATNKQGRAELAIEDGKTLDLGEIKVPVSMVQ